MPWLPTLVRFSYQGYFFARKHVYWHYGTCVRICGVVIGSLLTLTTDSIPYSAGCIERGGRPNAVPGHNSVCPRGRSPPEGGDNQLGLDFILILCLWFGSALITTWTPPSCFVFSEWYGYHFPELIKIVSDNATYCKLTKFIGNRKELSEESLEPLEEITMDSAKAQAILDASRSSMGETNTSIIVI